MDALLGKTLSHFRILQQLGAGGMGVVYLARDTSLGRDVAVKVLPAEFARDPERLARFRREAKVLASLNHPNIAAIYGLQVSDDGGLFRILERVECQTLRVRVRGGALPFQEALGVCSQIAKALAAAHERDVIHRDLKPANVMLTPLGIVKVLDFGLARRAAASTALEDEAAGNTTTFVTRPGVAMGTPGYLSPEQARGEEHDKRTDIFAFGCVLYECVTGQRAFGGGSVAEVMAGLLTKEPDWSALPAETSAVVRNLLLRCLEKDPRERLRDIGDARIEIDDLLGMRSPGGRTRAAPTAVPNNLPKQLTNFVGREAEIAECRQLLETCRLLTLTGMGGCGKTRLSLQIAGELLDQHPDGVWVVDLASLNDGSRVPQAVASVIEVRERPDKPLSDTLANHLRNRRELLVLDNCEHMRQPCAELAQLLLRECPELKLIATSREVLGVPGERAYAVPPLSLPHRGAEEKAAALGSYEAVRLFVDRASLVRSSFHLTDSNAPSVAEIVRRLDGLPLAIELAAARARVLSPNEIRAKLDDRFRLLTGGSSVGLPRHQTLEATVRWSYDQLTRDERQLLRAVSVFSGGWTLEAAAAVIDDSADEFAVLDLLTRLVDQSLVTVEGDEGGASRYGLLETIREYAVSQLKESGEESVLRDRHLGFFLALAETAGPHLIEEEEEVNWLVRLESEHENLLAALTWCERVKDGGEAALRLAGALGQFWHTRGHVGLGRKVLERALERGGAPAGTVARAKVLSFLASLTFAQGDYERAWSLGEASFAIYRELGDISGIARGLQGKAGEAIMKRDLGTARLVLEESLTISREAGYERGALAGLLGLGIVARLGGDFQLARRWFEESLTVSRRTHAKRWIVNNLINLADLSVKLGEPAKGRALLVEALRLIQELGARHAATGALESLAWVAAACGHPSSAARFFGAAEILRETMGIPLHGPQTDLEERDVVHGLVRGQLGEERFATGVAEGRALSFEAAIEDALQWLERVEPDPGAN